VLIRELLPSWEPSSRQVAASLFNLRPRPSPPSFRLFVWNAARTPVVELPAHDMFWRRSSFW